MPRASTVLVATICAAYCAVVDTAAPTLATKLVVDLRASQDRLFESPEGPFVVLRFPEDALGDHIGVVYYKNMSNPVDGSWSIDNRFWQDGEWTSDVTSFAWAETGRTLFVATSEVYGTGCVYRLDLMRKVAERIYPSAADVARYRSAPKGFTTTVLSVDEPSRRLKVRLETEDGKSRVSSIKFR